MSQKNLKDIFNSSNERWSTKWEHYFDIYERHLSKYRNREIHLLEFGVYQGGSLQNWKKYFGKKARIYGIDINPHCKKLEEDQIRVLIGDQGDPSFLKKIKETIPKIDIVIDDGGHMMNQQITTFKEIYNIIDENGVYICEDLHTSYWPRFGGGLNNKNTFINFSKKLIDDLHAYHVDKRKNLNRNFCKSTDSIHFYDSMLVIEKRKRNIPKEVESGTFDEKFPSIPLQQQQSSYVRTLFRRVRRRVQKISDYLHHFKARR